MVQCGSFKENQPLIKAFVARGDQTGFARLVHASMTTEAFVAQETMKPNPLLGPSMPVECVSING